MPLFLLLEINVGVNMDNSIINKSNINDLKFKLSFEIFDWIESIVFSLITVVLLFTFAFRIVGVQGYSMLQTLQNHDRLILTSFFYEPKQGDVVVISRKDNLAEPLIKRIIATEGQTVDINYDTNTVSVDGKIINEKYVNKTFTIGTTPFGVENSKNSRTSSTKVGVTEDNNGNKLNEYKIPISDSMTPAGDISHIKVQKGYVFVMGDNRNFSLDSRFLGQLGKGQILGKAIFRIYRDTNYRNSFMDMFGVVK
jgi:signal peptidase I